MLCINISRIKWRIEVIIWITKAQNGEGHGNALQYSCLENTVDRGAWWAAVHEVAKRWTRLSYFTFTFSFMHWRRKWQPTPVLFPEESQGRRSLVGCRLWGRTESDDWATSLSCVGEGNGNPLQCSFLENPRDGGAWWAAVYGGRTESDTTEVT